MNATLTTYRDLNAWVREFDFRLDDTNQHQSWSPGAHIRVTLGPPGKELIRHYSLIPAPNSSIFRVAVKRTESSRGGSSAMWSLQPGDRIGMSTPQNSFSLDTTANAYWLIAGGIGVTPLISMAKALTATGKPVRMTYIAHSQEHVVYASTLKKYLGDQLRVATRDNADIETGAWTTKSGTHAYVCGPDSLLKRVREVWHNAGHLASHLRHESFGNDNSTGQAFKVSVPRHKLTFDVHAGSSILDELESQGVQAMYGCRHGECGLCALPVLKLEGSIEHRDSFLSEHEKASNQTICICVSRAVGEITLDSAYRPEYA